MKKSGTIFIIIMITLVFLYSIGLVSSQNTCTGVRVYTCTAPQQANVNVSPQQQAIAPIVNTTTRAS